MSAEAIPLVPLPAARRRIEVISAATGRSVEDVAREAVEDGLDQIEYAAAIEGEVAAIRRGEAGTISQDELKHRLGDD
ncbi:MAG: hypothetical protein LBO20_03210 [Bifidobacteriaceae bacterium]|jgi:predicted DNA-binding protein|nr:hypothetical protein [Bifidobacteriaceae bacterium]